MSTSSLPPATTRPIVIGIDTHKDIHVAVALDQLGRRLAELHVPTTLAGYVRLEQWATSLGTVDVFGIEGTGSYGAGIARFLRQRQSQDILQLEDVHRTRVAVLVSHKREPGPAALRDDHIDLVEPRLHLPVRRDVRAALRVVLRGGA